MKQKETDFISKLLSNRHRERAFSQLLDQYQERLYWHIRKLVVTHENADDVLQNTFIRIYKSLPNFKQNSSLHTWMYRIAYNESLRFLEKNKKELNSSVAELHEKHLKDLFASEYFNANEVTTKLQKVLSLLSEKERNIFQMKYYDDLKFREISEILTLKEGTVKTLYYKATKFVETQIIQIQLVN